MKIVLQLEEPFEGHGRGLLPGKYTSVRFWRQDQEGGWDMYLKYSPVNLKDIHSFIGGILTGYQAAGNNAAEILVDPVSIKLGALIPSCRIITFPHVSNI